MRTVVNVGMQYYVHVCYYRCSSCHTIQNVSGRYGSYMCLYARVMKMRNGP